MKKYRLGIIRADTHGYYYGIMLDKCDPMVLSRNNYVVHHYATDIYDPKLLTVPQVPGFEITKVYDYKIEEAKKFSETFLGKPTVCQTVEEMTEDVDAVFICNCDLGGEDHLKLATPFLKKGIPTLVDKPFALTLADAQEIVRLARENHTPMFSASILTYVPAALRFKQRFEEIHGAYWPVPKSGSKLPIGLGVIKGVGGAFSQELGGKAVSGGLEDRIAYLIHGIALGLNLFGRGVEWVEAMGQLPLEYLHLHLKSGVEIMILNTSVEIFPEECSFYASAFSKYGAIHSGPIGDPQFLGGGEKIMQMFKQMLDSGKPVRDYDEIVEHNAVIEAGKLAQEKGSRVYLKDIWKR